MSDEKAHESVKSPSSTPWVREIFDEVVDEARSADRPVVRLNPPQVVVAAPDRPGLLSSMAGTFALHGLDVQAADVSEEGGVAIDTFTVRAIDENWPEEHELLADLESVLADRMSLSERFAATTRENPTADVTIAVVPKVTIDNSSSPACSVIELHASDQLGLLHRVTEALFDCKLDVVAARVSTLDDAVIDVFYVRGATGSKVTDPSELESLQRTLRDAAS